MRSPVTHQAVEPLRFVQSVMTPVLPILALMLSMPAYAQNCAPDSIFPLTQEDIVNFQAIYGPCDTVVGDLAMDSRPIANLDGLSGITSIGGELILANNSQLTSISGLSNLKTVEGISLDFNKTLGSLEGLSGLTDVMFGGIRIQRHPGLTSLAGLPATLNTLGGLTITGHDNLLSLDGAPTVSLVGDLVVSDNSKLTSLAGLSGIGEVFFTFELSGNDMLISLDGLPPWTSMMNLKITANAVLSDLDGLSSLERLDQDVWVNANPVLSNCSGLIKLLDEVDDGEPGPGPGAGHNSPDVGGSDNRFEENLTGCNSIEEIVGSGPGDDGVFADGFESGS